MLSFVVLFLILIILTGGHLLIGLGLVKFFSLPSGLYRFLAYLIPLGLAVGFIVFSALLHWKENWVTKAGYYLTSLWLGLAMNLLLAFFLGWILVSVFHYFGHDLKNAWTGMILIIAALGWTAYGVWSAGQIKVTTIEAKIPNLPAAWIGKTAVQISDVHLGVINQRSFAKKVVDLVNAQNPDIVFITGDLYDGTDGDLDELALPLEKLNAPLGIYYVTGNHEVYSGLAKVKEALKDLPLKWLNDSVIYLDGLQIAGINYPERGFKRDVAPVLKKIDPAKPSIFLYHDPLPSAVEAAKKAGVNLMLSGHTHKGQIFPAMFVTRLIYGQNFYGLSRANNFELYTTSGVGTWGPPLRTLSDPEIVKIIFK